MKHGLDCPNTYYINNEDDIKKILREVQYPCGIKPAHSHEWSKDKGSKKLEVVNSHEELLSCYFHLGM